jgi:hypothetical protein
MTLEYVKDNVLELLDTPVGNKPSLFKAGWALCGDGKMHFLQEDKKIINHKLVWRSANQSFDCRVFESEILFYRVYRGKVVPAACLDCWKVAMHPKTYSDLRKVEEFQQRSTWESKCGMETRAHVGFSWGAYWYAKGKVQGLERLAVVRMWMEKNLDSDTPLALKRGCTEYEIMLGDSEDWIESVEQRAIEDFVRGLVVVDPFIGDVPPVLVRDIHRRWRKFAHSVSDMTYLEDTGGKPIFEPLRGYGEE